MSNPDETIGSDDPTRYIKEMISNFKIPIEDALAECLFAESEKRQPEWSSAIFVSTRQLENFYSDIFQFWVRAFFCFVEDIQAGSLFIDAIPFIRCKKIYIDDFMQNYFSILHQKSADKLFVEQQAYHKTYIELEKRSFSDPYVVLIHPSIKSSIAYSNGEYVAFFMGY